MNKVSDLIKRAKQLADLEGSDFVSWNENISLLNEAYTELFQKMIDAGEKSFLKSFHMSSGAVKQPADFWQLKGVYVYNNGNLSTINRRAGNQNLNALSYELKNGQIIVYGYAGDVLVEYFPRPKKLTYKPAECLVNLPSEDYLDCYRHTFLYKSVENGNETLSILDLDGLKTAENILTVSHENIYKAFIAEDYVVVLMDDASTVVYNISAGLYTTIEAAVSPVFTPDGNVFFQDGGDISMIEIINEEESNFIKMTDAPYTGGEVYVCNEGFTDFFYLTSGIIYHNGEKAESDFISDKIAYKDGECYFLRQMSFGKVSANNEVEIIDPAPGLFVGFVGLDETTGYGYITKKFGKFFVCPYAEDTILDFPNSFFYKYISFSLAISYKIKQGADTSGLSAQLQSALDVFLDTLGEDSNQYPRMGNVYN